MLQLLLSFLSNVISRDKVNKMNLNNVAMIVAPNLFLSSSKTQASADEVKRAQGTVNIVRMLIKYQAILWTVSCVCVCLFVILPVGGCLTLPLCEEVCVCVARELKRLSL